MSRRGRNINRADTRSKHVDLHEADEPTSAEYGHQSVLNALIRATMPDHILELGTSNGNTTLSMAKTLQELGYGGQITTIEIDPGSAKQAKQTLESFNVTVIEDDYNNVPFVEFAPFDLVHIDANWTKRVHKTQLVLPFLSNGGLLVLHDMGNASPGHQAIPFLKQLGLEIIQVFTPRGTVIAQRPPA